MTEKKKSPYHNVPVTNGTYGEVSKILEEVEEAMDADQRGLKVLVLVELSDMIGATLGYLEKHAPGMTLEDLVAFAETIRKLKSEG